MAYGNFKIDLGDGWEQLKNSFANDKAFQKILPDISSSILKFHSTLETRVDTLFNNKTKLSSVLQGNDLSFSKTSANVLNYGLTYNHKAINLAEFRPVTVTRTTNVRNAIPGLRDNGNIGYVPVNKARIAHVKVRKGKPNTRTGAYPYFYLTKKKRMLARKQKTTWEQMPRMDKTGNIVRNTGTYAPLTGVFGPSLMQQATGVFDKDKVVAKAFIKMQDEILNSMVRAYENA